MANLKRHKCRGGDNPKDVDMTLGFNESTTMVTFGDVLVDGIYQTEELIVTEVDSLNG